jgi:mono/diheme cytochrome c family protein
MSARVVRGVGGAAALVLTAVVAMAQSPADEARLKKLDAGAKTIDVSQYAAEQQRAYKVFQAKCSSCHVIARGINSDMVVPADWERYIKRMMYKPNSGISSDEGRTLYRFLTYDASVRKADLLRTALAALPAVDRTVAIERIKAVNPAFVAP